MLRSHQTILFVACVLAAGCSDLNNATTNDGTPISARTVNPLSGAKVRYEIQTCPAVLQNFVFAPGETVELAMHQLDVIDQITKESGAGTYYMTARIHFIEPDFTTSEFPAGQVELPGGQ